MKAGEDDFKHDLDTIGAGRGMMTAGGTAMEAQTATFFASILSTIALSLHRVTVRLARQVEVGSTTTVCM